MKRQRFFLWLLLTLFFLLNACSSSNAKANNYPIQPENIDSSFMKINILNSFLINSQKQNFLPLTELSDLAWDEDEKLLYAVSDEGYLYHFKINIDDKKLKTIDLVFSTHLKDKHNKPLKGKFRDSEGLTLRNGNNTKLNDSQLIISFENAPRITSYLPNGRLLKNINISKKLSNQKSYRSNNKSLESVILHPQYGILTAAELPLKENSLNKQTLYSNTGKEWHFTSTNIKNSSITALEILPNKNILLLERAYNGLLSPVIISLRELKITQCENKSLCDTKLLASLDSSEGWRVDNFEGLTRIRNNLYLMISDNNKSPLQKTILVLFEIIE